MCKHRTRYTYTFDKVKNSNMSSTEETTAEKLNKILWDNITLSEGARPMKVQLQDDLLKFIESEKMRVAESVPIHRCLGKSAGVHNKEIDPSCIHCYDYEILLGWKEQYKPK